jgi:hypothetical protein
VEAGVLGAAVEGQLNDAHLAAYLVTKIPMIHCFIYSLIMYRLKKPVTKMIIS